MGDFPCFSRFAEKLGYTNWQASTGVISRFNLRKNIVSKKVTGESASVNPDSEDEDSVGTTPIPINTTVALQQLSNVLSFCQQSGFPSHILDSFSNIEDHIIQNQVKRFNTQAKITDFFPK